jgi:hypothetical protein
VLHAADTKKTAAAILKLNQLLLISRANEMISIFAGLQ